MKKIFSRAGFLLATLVVGIFSTATPAFAVSAQRKGIERYPFYDKTAETICGNGVSGGTTATAQNTSAKGGPLWFLGDSIGVGLKQAKLESQLSAQGYTPQMNVSTSRSINGAGIEIKTSGLQAVDTDAAFIRTAQTVIIELGTNPENNFGANLTTLTNKIKTLNPAVKIYLIDVAASPQAAQRIGAANTNKAIYAKAAELGTPVISRFKIYYPNGDPQTYAGATSPALPFDSLGVHSVSTEDYQKLNDVIKLNLSVVPQSSSAPISCCPTSAQATNAAVNSGGTLTGGSNEEKIFNYLIGKGLSVNQAAGIMGNIQAESGFDSAAVEKGGTGIGIIQWSFGRNAALKAAAIQKGVPWQDLGFQLDFMWNELNTSYKKSVLDPIRAAATLQDATYIWLTKYEIPADIPGQFPKRVGFALKVLRQPYAIAAGANPDAIPAGITGTTTSANCTTGTTTTIGGDTATKIVTIAMQELAAGASEANGGYLKYTDGRNENWCADFASWVLNQAGVPFTGGQSGGWRIAAVDGVQAWFQQQGKFRAARAGYIPKPGDIAIFNQGLSPYPSHVAIVISVSGTSMTVIGGNQSNKITQVVHKNIDASYVSGYGAVSQ